MAIRYAKDEDYDSFFKTVEEKCKAFVDSARRNKFEPNKLDDCITGLRSLKFMLEQRVVEPKDKKIEVIRYVIDTIKIIEIIKEGTNKYDLAFKELKQKITVFVNLKNYFDATENPAHKLDLIGSHPDNQAWLNVHKELKKAVGNLLNFHRNFIEPVTQGDDVKQFHNQVKSYISAIDINELYRHINNVKDKIRAAKSVPFPTLPITTPDPKVNTINQAFNQCMTAIQTTFDNEIKNDVDNMLVMAARAISIYRDAVVKYYKFTE
jgi:hypothetical protein